MSARWLSIAGTLKYEGDWGQPCQRVVFAISEHDNFIEDNALRHKALVIMNLQGSGLDPTLTLYESDRNGTVGAELAHNDDNPPRAEHAGLPRPSLPWPRPLPRGGAVEVPQHPPAEI